MGSARDVGQLSRAILADSKGVVAVLKVYLDESGTHGDASPVVSVGGYIGRPRAWEAWTRAWNFQKRPIKVFHSVDCNGFRKEFEGWNRDDRNALVARLLKVITDHDIRGFGAAIQLDDFRTYAADKPHILAIFKTPYVACFQWAAMMLADLLKKHAPRETVAFFHEENDYTTEAHEAFEYVRHTGMFGDRLVSLTFGPKAKYTPLQSADIMAYEINHYFREGKKPRRSWDALHQNGRAPYVRFVDKESLPGLVGSIEILREATMLNGTVSRGQWDTGVTGPQLLRRLSSSDGQPS